MTNEILEEVRAIKDRLWKEADGDLQKFGEQVRQFYRDAPTTGPILRTAEDLRRYAESGALPPLAVREEEGEYGDGPGKSPPTL